MDQKHRDVQAFAMDVLARITPRWHEFTSMPELYTTRTVEFLLLHTKMRRLGLPMPRTVLEVGCGDGYSAMLWTAVAEQVVGVDLPEEISSAQRLQALLLPSAPVRFEPGTAEALDGLHGAFDLIVTQYVLEHVADIGRSLANLRGRVAPGGMVVHVLANTADRLDAYVSYRLGTDVLRRVWHSLRDRGAFATLLDPLGHTPPHAPEFGPFRLEHTEYRLERWALRCLRADFEIVDFFQTRDTNWVLVTKPRALARGVNV